MGLIENDFQKETVSLLNKCWMTHDGMWFFHCLKELGIEKTNEMNKAAIQSLATIEIPRIRKMIQLEDAIETFEDVKRLFNGMIEFIIPDFMNLSVSYPKENVIQWNSEDRNCFAYKGIQRIGAIEKYECGVLFRIQCWLNALKIPHRFEPEIGLCKMHHEGFCKGCIHLFTE